MNFGLCKASARPFVDTHTACGRIWQLSLRPCHRQLQRVRFAVASARSTSELLSPRPEASIVAFPALLCAGTSVACFKPAALNHFHVDATLTLGFALFCIASTTTFAALGKVLSPPAWPSLAMAFVVGMTVFPGLCFLAATSVTWSPATVLGLAVLAACPPGTASNMVGSRVARADVALTSALSVISTLAGAVLFTVVFGIVASTCPAAAAMAPAWASDAIANIFFEHTLKGVALPILAGLTFSALLPSISRLFRPLAPFLGASMILLTVTNKTAHAAPLLSSTPTPLILAVIAIHAAAFALGYVLAKLSGCSESVSRTCSLQASERNPALGAALALSYFPEPAVVVPCIVGVFAQNILGSTLAVWWGRGADKV